jgi:hypothetical protein
MTERRFPIVLNQSNLSNTTTNASFTYQLPGGASTFKNCEVCISQINMYNSIFNINQQLYNNNTFSIIFPTAATTYTLNITLPNSNMSTSDINSYVQQQMINAGAYLVNGSTNVYFWNIQENPTLYSTQINEFSVPTALGSYTRPATGIYSATGTGLPATAYTPQTVITSNGFRSLVGLAAGTYPSVQQTSTYSVSSTFTPQINPVQSLNVHCSLVSNKYCIPPDYIGNFNPNGVNFGQLFSYVPTSEQWVDINDQTIAQINVYFTDQNNNTVYINDPTTTICLLIKQKFM